MRRFSFLEAVMPDLDLIPACAVCGVQSPTTRHTADGRPLCWSCFQVLPRCHECGCATAELLDVIGGGRVCRGCAGQLRACVSCGGLTIAPLPTDTDSVICASCTSTGFEQCWQCSRFSADSRYLSGGSRVCQVCGPQFESCAECGTLVRPGRSCDRCADPRRVWGYVYKPDPVFHGQGPVYLGLELEIIVPELVYDDAVAEVAARVGNLAYLKQDSSIRPNGFELVTHPMSFQWAIDHFPWSLLTDLREMRCEADGSVGLHVHVSRAGFDGPAHIYRWLKLVYRNETAITRLARRRSTRYAPFDARARARARDSAKGASVRDLPRRMAVNVQPRHTLEVRVFASSLQMREVQAALAFVAGSVEYTRALTVPDLCAGAWEWERFAAWVAERAEYAPLTGELEDLACAC
ncbi:hypothetical protein [Nocardia puris]|uniref:hypothetical protein n=1 Tax=Nocardia puris TaxID=208602 RepID=UPI002E1E4C0F